jgi:hypothetical protein
MDETQLDSYTRRIFHLLACEDPAHPNVHFLLRLREDVRRTLMKSDHACDLSEETTGRHLTEAVRRFAREFPMEEVLGGWHVGDIYEKIAVYIGI